jgi:hypothetical protein
MEIVLDFCEVFFDERKIHNRGQDHRSTYAYRDSGHVWCHDGEYRMNMVYDLSKYGEKK